MKKTLVSCIMALCLTACGNGEGEQRTVTFLKKFTTPKLKVVTDEPQIYTFDDDGDFFKIIEGKKYKIWIVHPTVNPIRIYDVGEEVK